MELTIAERIDRAVIAHLKNVRLGGQHESNSWESTVIPEIKLAGEKPKIISEFAFLLLSIHQAIWDRDTNVRNAKVNFMDDEQLSRLGALAVDARDFNHLRTKVVDILNHLCGQGSGSDPNIGDGRLAKE